MLDYKIILSGGASRATFFCERCSLGGDGVEITATSRGKLLKKVQKKQPGVCVNCGGSRRESANSSRPCTECGGSGVCPECNGSFARSWNDLPVTAQAKILSRLEHGEDLVAGYEVTTGLIRELF